MKHPLLMGTVAGDVIGSEYEFNPVKTTDFPIFGDVCEFTDDSIMTMAVAEWVMGNGKLIPLMQKYGRNYPSSYGTKFALWIYYKEPHPYNSWGNGSAMRVSPVGWAYDTMEETLAKAKESAEVTHNHPEGIKGAQVVAAAIFLARTGASKGEIKDYLQKSFGLDLHTSCEIIRPVYKFYESCQMTVPQAVVAFLESRDYEDAVRLAISLGGDADTLAAITGSIAEAYYKEIPSYIVDETSRRLPDKFLKVMKEFTNKYGK